MRLAVRTLAALSLAVPLAGRAQSAAPSGPDVPAGYFSTVFRTWSLTSSPTSTCAIPGQPCFSGFAVFGQRAGTTDALGYRLVVGLQSSNPPSQLTLGLPYGQNTINGAVSYFETNGTDGASYGANASGPWIVGVASGGQFPEFYVGGASPYTFNVTQVGAEYYYYDNGGAETSDAFLTATATPEPATLVLTLGGLAALGMSARRRRNA